MTTSPFSGTPGQPTGNTSPSPSIPPAAPTGVGAPSTQGDVHWKLETIEPKNLKFINFSISGQFPVKEEGITVRMNDVVPDVGTFGIAQPFIQWVRGEVEIISFDVVLFSRDKNEDPKVLFDNIAKVKTFVKELGRTPVCRFTYGNILSVKCMVLGFGEVKYSRPRTDGKARKIEFTLTLKRFNPYKIEEIDRNKKPKFSRMQSTAGDLRMYEVLARREYGSESAIYGDRLRKLNRANPFASEDGGRTKVPVAERVVGGPLAPEFHGFRIDRDTVAEVFRDRAVARNARVLVV
jgi:hypothetical protein